MSQVKISKASRLREKDLVGLFTSLSDRTLVDFTAFGKVNELSKARSAARALIEESEREIKLFGLFADGVLVSFGFLRFFKEPRKRFNCTLGLVTADEHQGKGLGKRLVSKMVSWARLKGYRKIWLTVYEDNLAAIRLYSSMGFEIEGIFMHDEWHDGRPRNIVSMALFFHTRTETERKRIFKKLHDSLKS